MFDEDRSRWSTERAELRELLGDDAWLSARRTVLNAHYTDAEVAGAVWSAVEALGFTGGRALEPGCGAGNFIGLTPSALPVDWVGVELDPTTGAIARQLYPEADIRIEGFERSHLAPGSFDLALGNVPFGSFRVPDPVHNPGRHNIHNHFIVKSLDLVRPGGLVAVLTSRYTLDSHDSSARSDMAARADLVGAVRLPQGAFQAAAGTKVICDLLIFRRRAEGDPARPADWLDLAPVDQGQDTGVDVAVNRWFIDHPELVIGTMSVGHGMYRGDDLVVSYDGNNLPGAIRTATQRLVEQGTARGLAYRPGRPADTAVEVASAERAPESAKEGTLLRRGEGFGVVHYDRLEPYEPRYKKDAAELGALLDLRDAAVALLEAQSATTDDAGLEVLQERLGDLYEAYTARWGAINRYKLFERTDAKTGEQRVTRRFPSMGGFRSDPAAAVVFALENFDDETGRAGRAAIFTRRVVAPVERARSAETPADALALTLDELGRPDIHRIAQLLAVDAETAQKSLGHLVWEDPGTGELKTATEYLSGNVRSKLAEAQLAAETDPRWQANVAALTEVMPTDLTPGEIDARPGATWIPPEDLAAFVREVLGAPRPTVFYEPKLGSWTIEAPGQRFGLQMRSEWGTDRAAAIDLLQMAANQRTPRVYDEVDERKVLNRDATLAAVAKQEELIDRFGSWVWEDAERANRLAATYNTLFRSHVVPGYDGSHLHFPGLAQNFTPHQHQRDAVWRILSEPATLLAHGVGAGKTATMVMAAVEMRRLGLADKPVIVVPNHMLEQFSREAQQLYPLGKFLIGGSTEVSKEHRKRFVARCAMGEWDAVIMTQSAFKRLPLSTASQRQYLDRELEGLREALKASEEHLGKKARTTKQLENAAASTETQLTELLDAEHKDDGVTMEQSGIDCLFIDEAHHYKNRRVASRIEGAAISNPSQMAADLDAKLLALRSQGRERVAVLATATPIANSVSEMWVMQSYLQPERLEEAGVAHFDAWAAAFGATVTSLELSVDGQSFEPKTRFARFRNVPELVGMFAEAADVRLAGALNLNVPALAGGRVENVVVPASAALGHYMEDLGRRLEDIRNRVVEPNEDNVLVVNTDGRKAGLDVRLVGLDPEPPTKVELAADRVTAIWRANVDREYLDPISGERAERPGAFQLVFCDANAPKDNAWSVYSELRDQLVVRGMPAERIRFIHEAATDKAKANLFAACRDGRVAVLLGSTAKMGVGTNVQARAIALHHLDAPWRPADIEQREGRIIRQGNQNAEVSIFRYATERSYDTRIWQTLERKATFIAQVMSGQVTDREIDDVGDAALSFSELKALASGNPLVIELAEVDAEVMRLSRLADAHAQDQHALRWRRGTALESAALADRRAALAESAITTRIDTRGDAFGMTLRGAEFEKRPEAGMALAAELKGYMTGAALVDVTPIGQLGGFDLVVTKAKYGPEGSATVALSGTGETVTFYRGDLNKQPHNLVVMLENRLHHLDESLCTAVANAGHARAEAEAAEARIGLPFPHAERLELLRWRKAEIELELTPTDESAETVKDDESEQTTPSVEAERDDDANAMTVGSGSITRRVRPPRQTAPPGPPGAGHDLGGYER